MFNRNLVLAASFLAAALTSQAAVTLSASPASNPLPLLPQPSAGMPGQGSATFTLTATGSGTSTFTIRADPPFSASCTDCAVHNTITAGNSQTITVIANSGQMQAGTYPGIVSIFTPGTNGSTVEVNVSFTILGVDINVPPSLTFLFGSQTSSSVAVQASPDQATIIATPSPGATWLSVSGIPQAGLVVNGSASFQVNINTANQNPTQPLTATITVSCPTGSPCQPATITVTVQPPPFTLSPISQTVPLTANAGSTTPVLNSATVMAGGTGGGSVLVTSDSAWLTGKSTPAAVTAPGNITISITATPNGSGTGPPQGSLTVSVGTSAVTIVVTLTITATPAVVGSLNPNNATAGGPAFPLTVTGSGFTSTATIMWNSISLLTTFGSPTTLSTMVPANLIASPAPVTITVVSGGSASNGVPFTINPGTSLTSGTLANGATYIAGGLVPGSWAQVKGLNLATVTQYTWQSSDFVGLGNNLPTKLHGTSVTVNNLPAAVYYVDATQVNFQVPTGVSGTVSVQVTNNGQISNAITASATASSPGIFPVIVNGTNYAGGVFTDNKYIGDPSAGSVFRNAKPGDVIQLFATGLTVTPSGVLITPQGVGGVTVTIGSLTFPADFAGLVAVGEFQINFTVPQQFATMAAASYPITIAVNGVSSPATINSTPPGPVVIPIQP